MKSLVSTVLILCLFFNGCTNKVITKYDPLIHDIEDRGLNINKYDYILLLPSEGCGGCINGAESFLINNYLQQGGKRILFVVTGHTSKKTLRNRLGDNIFNSDDVIADYKSIYSRPPYLEIYPKLFTLKNGEIIIESNIDPNSSEKIYKNLLKTF